MTDKTQWQNDLFQWLLDSGATVTTFRHNQFGEVEVISVTTRPDLSLYIGKKIVAVNQGDIAWQWEIVLDDGTVFRNKSRNEIMAPHEIVGGTFKTVGFSLSDTTLHVEMPNGFIQKISFNPTQYTIFDQAYGSDVYPQWPEELEAAGITSHPEEDASGDASEEWPERRQELLRDAHERHTTQAREFVEGDAKE